MEPGKNLVQPVRQRVEVANVQRGDTIAMPRARSTASRMGPWVDPQPTNKTWPSGVRRPWDAGNLVGQACSLRRRLAVIWAWSRGGRRMSHLVVFEPGNNWVAAAQDPGAGSHMPRTPSIAQIVRLGFRNRVRSGAMSWQTAA
jgi:hypothetical protein